MPTSKKRDSGANSPVIGENKNFSDNSSYDKSDLIDVKISQEKMPESMDKISNFQSADCHLSNKSSKLIFQVYTTTIAV